ncbi:MAG: sigma-70 family RNA polymerase sigma factor [Nitrospinota bacterium]|nr:MAG: sigma-70 family RNA polymerase sigma factor [Nitrospinota bacterium]
MWKRRKRHQFERLTQPHLHTLYSLALQMTRDPADAEDMVQETYVKAYKAFDQLKDRSRCKAWLLKIAINIYRDWYRKMMREPMHISFDGSAPLLQLLGNHRENPERLVVDKTMGEEVQLALDELPPEFKIVILLADVEELSYREIAEILDCPIGTVMSRIHRGRKLLRSSLCEYARRFGYVC